MMSTMRMTKKASHELMMGLKGLIWSKVNYWEIYLRIEVRLD